VVVAKDLEGVVTEASGMEEEARVAAMGMEEAVVVEVEKVEEAVEMVVEEDRTWCMH
jgi:hypothetical protein